VSKQDLERERLVAAITRVAAEQGYANLTVEQVVRYAGVSSATFHEHFSSTDQALMVAFDSFLNRLWAEVASACEGEEEWPAKVRAVIDTILSYLAEANALARLFAVEAAMASLAVAERQFAALESFATMLRDGRKLYPRASSLPAPTERALVGGIASIISSHLLAEEPRALPGLESELAELVLVPYLGASEARRVARA
jgi:TetR/AcrR family transcriptional regulator